MIDDRILRLPRKLGRPARPRPITRDVFGTFQTPVSQQEQLETEFFKRVVLPNGTFKTTNPHRLDDLNLAVFPFLARIAERPVKILDVAISSGVSTIEWYDQLTDARIPCEFTGTDLIVNAWLMSLTRHLGVLVDRDRNFLHLDAFGHGAPPTASGARGIFACILRGVFRAAIQIDKTLPHVRCNADEPPRGWLLTCEPVKLLTRKLAERDCVRIIEEDLLTPETPENRRAFHVVRAANVLNRAYFPEATLLQMANKLRARLKPRGLLIVSRTTSDAANHATICELVDEGRLRVVHLLGGGSEIEDLLAASSSPAL